MDVDSIIGCERGEFKVPEYAVALITHILNNKRDIVSKCEFKFNKVNIRWCGNLNALTSNVRMNEKGWITWFNACMRDIRKDENVFSI